MPKKRNHPAGWEAMRAWTFAAPAPRSFAAAALTLVPLIDEPSAGAIRRPHRMRQDLAPGRRRLWR